jgi:endonuclease/exonuclease/phosphatase family metal-dependent hydrolase
MTARRLRLLSYNIQLGLSTGHYGHYFTRAWRHALPGPGMLRELDRIADLARDYDFVAVQEADAGSLRTMYLNQVEYLAGRAEFPHWGIAITRDLRPVARHCLGFLSRLTPMQVTEHALPSLIPGRRALEIVLGAEAGGLRMIVTHLSLGAGARKRQLDYLGRVMAGPAPAILLGDLNCEHDSLQRHPAFKRTGRRAVAPMPTFPSWRPTRHLDHILVPPEIELHSLHAPPVKYSDHLPVAAEISIP